MSPLSSASASYNQQNMKNWFSKDAKPDNRSECQNKDKPKTSEKLTKSFKLPDFPKNFKLPNLDKKQLTGFIHQLMESFRHMGGAQSQQGGQQAPRHMKYPYTLGAKIAQFPYKYYYKNNWIFRYYPIGFITCLPIFWYINQMCKYSV